MHMHTLLALLDRMIAAYPRRKPLSNEFFTVFASVVEGFGMKMHNSSLKTTNKPRSFVSRTTKLPPAEIIFFTVLRFLHERVAGSIKGLQHKLYIDIRISKSRKFYRRTRD